MNILQNKLNSCNNCPFEDYDINWYNEKTGTGKLGAHIYKESDNSIMVIGQNPSNKRYFGSHSFSGHQGDPFREIFSKEKLVFSNFIQISTPDNKVDYLTDEQINHCINHLLEEIKYLKPKTIILCSSFAKKKLESLDRILNVISGQMIFYLKHPDYYMSYHKGDIEDYYKELRKIKQLCI